MSSPSTQLVGQFSMSEITGYINDEMRKVIFLIIFAVCVSAFRPRRSQRPRLSAREQILLPVRTHGTAARTERCTSVDRCTMLGLRVD